MKNKKEGFRRISVIASWVLCGVALLLMMDGMGDSAERYIESAGAIGVAYFVFIAVLWGVPGFLIPRVLFWIGCYIADGFKSE
ncbi:hypothetical protein [Alteromonas sp. RKMC-009]|uniref:hypothetical protein n=1 Tax=Alteromonas sp. RKMC-009 TaxID=2267264 RepID=UPI000E678569|nr:hypothetical protein [Alteromonas sp. RKMC-009]AYA64264.1 hypothetical protein DS731_09815 [Alteromonas sp. RKMC-009]